MSRSRVRWGRLAVAGTVVAGLCAACAGGDRLAAPVDSAPAAEVEAGLREALALGARRAVVRTGRRGGFERDPGLHIGLPRELSVSASALREAGMGWAADELEQSLNRSAELTAEQAGPLLEEAIAGLPLSDADLLLRGDSAAGTRRLRDFAGDRLRQELAPVAERAMDRTGLEQRYRDLASRMAALDLREDPELALDDYVVDRTLVGLFAVIEEEELRIRDTPAARTSERLRRVFGAR